jgi:hypothetical protein
LATALLAGILSGIGIYAFEAFMEMRDLDRKLVKPITFLAMVVFLLVPGYVFAIGAPPKVREGIRGLPLNEPPPRKAWPKKLFRGLVFLATAIATVEVLESVHWAI